MGARRDEHSRACTVSSVVNVQTLALPTLLTCSLS